MSKYLFIGFHIDDCELSCGGTMAKLIEQNHTVDYFAMSFGGADGKEFLASKAILGFGRVEHPILCAEEYTSQMVANFLYSIRGNYDFVFTHSINDRHSLHRMTAEESRRVFNSNLITYLAPWNGQHEENYFVEITGEQLEKKINALWSYRSQAHRPYMSADFIRAQAVYNGIKCGKKYAEAYKIHRMIL